MRCGRTYRWTRMHRHRALFRELGIFFAVRSWAGCITNMFGFDLRQAQGTLPFGSPFNRAVPDKVTFRVKRRPNIPPEFPTNLVNSASEIFPEMVAKLEASGD